MPLRCCDPRPVPLDALPALAAMAAGVATLVWLARLAGASGDADRGAGLGADLGADLGARPGASRRGFVVGALGVTALSVLAAVGGQLRSGAQRIKKVVLPAAADKAKATADRPRDDRSPASRRCARRPRSSTASTPTSPCRRSTSTRWTLEVDGMVEKPFTLTFAELAAMPLIERDITMTCVSNEVGGGYIGAARWLGVRLTDVLDRAGTTGSPTRC